MHLVEVGCLVENDIFVVDNCSIHFHGENEFLAQELWEQLRILMIPLPPYSPELNPMEFVFQYLVQQMRSSNIRASCEDDNKFVQRLETVIDEMEFEVVWKQFRHCGYLKNM